MLSQEVQSIVDACNKNFTDINEQFLLASNKVKELESKNKYLENRLDKIKKDNDRIWITIYIVCFFCIMSLIF